MSGLVEDFKRRFGRLKAVLPTVEAARKRNVLPFHAAAVTRLVDAAAAELKQEQLEAAGLRCLADAAKASAASSAQEGEGQEEEEEQAGEGADGKTASPSVTAQVEARFLQVLAVCGWDMASSQDDGGDAELLCDWCYRSIPLPALSGEDADDASAAAAAAPGARAKRSRPAAGSPEGPRPTKRGRGASGSGIGYVAASAAAAGTKLDPLGEHRWFCPWHARTHQAGAVCGVWVVHVVRMCGSLMSPSPPIYFRQHWEG